MEDGGPPLEYVLGVVADVRRIAVQENGKLKVLDPPARHQGVVGLPVQLAPVADAAVQGTHVHVVKGGVLKGPVELRVLNVEVAVGRHPGRLDGADVGADDGRRRVRVGHVNRPDAGPRADVENLGRRSRHRRREEPVAHEHGNKRVR